MLYAKIIDNRSVLAKLFRNIVKGYDFFRNEVVCVVIMTVYYITYELRLGIIGL